MTPTEAVSMLEKAWQENKRLRQENATITAERDEARREVCEMRSEELVDPITSPKKIAQQRGWDCFEEDGK
jgi:hypothetical protein